jgi:ABC-type Fe3+/spermidine/putrescine transport system ATPase subunit
MFQDYALFPHLDVASNVAFGLRMLGTPAREATARVAELLALVGLAGYERRRVYQLSGGERQRVALARTLAPGPRLLMLDEPLGALDRALRERLLEDLAAILRRLRLTTLYVTHDQEEAFAIADTLVLMRAGRVEQSGPPQAVYRAPASAFAARFLGIPNLVPAAMLEIAGESTVVLDSPLGALRAAAPHSSVNRALPVTIAIRAESAELTGEPPGGATGIITGTVEERTFRGSRTRVTLRHHSGHTLTFDLDSHNLPATGEPITLALRPDAISILPDEQRDEG